MSRIEFGGNRDDPDYVYYNALIINNKIQTTQDVPNPEIVFQDTRDVPILRDASAYEVSVENVTINGAVQALPIFIPQIQTPVADINATVYTLTFGITDLTAGNTYQDTQPIYWSPQDIGTFSPAPPVGTATQTESPYYYMYTYSHWVDLMNKTLGLAYANVKAAAAAGGFVIGTKCPFFSYNPETGKFSISSDANTALVPYGQDIPSPYNYPSTAAGYAPNEASLIGMNINLYNLLSNIPVVITSGALPWFAGVYPEVVVRFTVITGTPENTASLTTGKSYSTLTTNVGIVCNPFSGIFGGEPAGNTAGTAYITMTEEAVSTDCLWSPVQSIVVSTALIPVINEFASNPVQLGNANLGTQQGSSGAFNHILTEIPFQTGVLNTNSGFFFYEPNTPRYSTLSPAKVSLRTLDFQLKWRNRLTNTLQPLRLSNLGTASVRLLFKKKTASG